MNNRIAELSSEKRRLKNENPKEYRKKERQIDMMKAEMDSLKASQEHIVTFAYAWLDNVSYIHDDVLSAMRA